MSSNPILTENALKRIDYSGLRPMTVSNTIQKFFILMIPFLISALAVYYQFQLAHYDLVKIITTVTMFLGIILAFIISFNQKTTVFLAPVYAFCEGAFISGVSCVAQVMFPGIVIQAVCLTFVTALVMGVLFSSGIITVSEKFRSIVISATIAIAIFYLISIVLIWGFHMDLKIFYSSSPISIGFSVFVCILAALNLLLDYDFIQKAVANRAPEEFGWYAAFGLMVTLVWLYIEVLRLLEKLYSRR